MHLHFQALRQIGRAMLWRTIEMVTDFGVHHLPLNWPGLVNQLPICCHFRIGHRSNYCRFHRCAAASVAMNSLMIHLQAMNLDLLYLLL